jgi:putative multiple sugar transport system ATP-binding protein
MSDTILEMRNITKTFTGVKALDDVSLKVGRDEIHALVGENGAGKSTLMKILSGVYPNESYTGSIHYEGSECRFRSIADSEKLGIVIIHQELALIPYLSIAENIFLGNEQAKGGVINWQKTAVAASELLAKVGLVENPNLRIADIGVGKQQLVEIARALAKKVKLLILDEPTAALNDEESDKLLNLLLELKKQGVTSILISHKLGEIAKVSDSITVIRDGKVIETLENETHQIDQDRIIKSMVGREIVDRFPKRDSKIGDVVFEVEGWNVYDPLIEDRKVISDVTFNVRKGEVVGLAGLMGAGRTEIAMSLFGRSYGQRHSGKIRKNGVEVKLDTVSDSIARGVAYLTEDRKNYGLVLIEDVKSNASLPSLGKLSKRQVINRGLEYSAVTELQQQMRIRCTGIDQIVESLSGGNQQKVVLSKWIMSEPDILFLDEPTRGIDVGAKYEIYTIINRLVSEGKSVIMISSEMPELLGMCDRIYVVTEGEIAGELDREHATQESIMSCIMNHKRGARI